MFVTTLAAFLSVNDSLLFDTRRALAVTPAMASVMSVLVCRLPMCARMEIVLVVVAVVVVVVVCVMVRVGS